MGRYGNEGKKIPHKTLRYFSLIPRLMRLYSCRHSASEMRWHNSSCPKEEGVQQHPINGAVWKHFNTTYPDFAADPKKFNTLNRNLIF